MNLEEIVNHFPGTKKRIGNKLFVQCSAHKPDSNPSLELSIGENGKLLIFCHAGCSTEDVLREADLTFADIMPERGDFGSASDDVADQLFAALGDGVRKPSKNGNAPNGNGKKEVARYNYYDEFGELLLQVRRYEPKTFRQFKPHETKPNEWIPNVKDVRRVPYNLPYIMNAKVNDRIVIVEGEKSADAVSEKLGFISTTFLGGANKWQEHYADFFEKRLVVVVPDNDKPGKEHSELVASKLFKVAREVRVVDLSEELKPGQDIYDWLEDDHDRADFERAILLSEVYNGLPLPFISFSQLMAEELKVEWLVKDIIPTETGGALVGPSGAGKTWILLDLALAMATGGKWLGRFPVRQGTVAIVDEENSRMMIQERLIKMGRCRGIKRLDDIPIHLLIGKEVDFTPKFTKGELEFTRDHYKLVESLNLLNADLVIMDSLTRIHRVDENSASEMSKVFASLKNIIRGAKTGAMFTHHYNKGEGRSTMNRIRGSSDIRAWCDWTLAIEQIEREYDGTKIIKVEHDKSRYGEEIAIFKVALKSVWYGDDQGMNLLNQGDIEPGRPTKTADVWEWIKNQLKDGASMHNSAMLTLAGESSPGFGLTKLKTELAKRHRNGQLEKGEDGRQVVWSMAKSKDEDLHDFADAANKS